MARVSSMALQVNPVVVRAFATARDYESAIIPEMTARRLMTLAARYFLTAFLVGAAPFQARPRIDA